MIIFYPKVYYQRQARDVVCRNIRRSEWFRAKQIYETTNRLSDKSLCGTGTCQTALFAYDGGSVNETVKLALTTDC